MLYRICIYDRDFIFSFIQTNSLSINVQDVLRGRRRRGYDPHDERYYVSDTNTGRPTGLNHDIGRRI